MSKILTSLKLLLLVDKIKLELPHRHICRSDQQRDKIYQFVRFIIFVYLPYFILRAAQLMLQWMIWSCGTEYWRPQQQWNENCCWKSIPKTTHGIFLKNKFCCLYLVLKFQIWRKGTYFQKLMTYKPSKSFANRHGTGFCKPVLPNIQEKAKLGDFVGPSSQWCSS